MNLPLSGVTGEVGVRIELEGEGKDQGAGEGGDEGQDEGEGKV